jgi:hypothetical protein
VRLSLKGNAGGWKESKESKKTKELSVREVKKKKIVMHWHAKTVVLWRSQMADSCTTKRRVPLDREESAATEEDMMIEEGTTMKRRARGETTREGGQ